MKWFTRCFAWTPTLLSLADAQVVNVSVALATARFEADNTAFVYGSSPFLVANDGSAAEGGFRTFSVTKNATLGLRTQQRTGRSKIVVPVYDVAGRDVIINVPAPTSLIRVFDAHSGREVDSNDKKELGDWSTACVWRSAKSGESYIFLFGKQVVVQFLVRAGEKDVEILEIQRFSVPIEGEACSVLAKGQVFFSAKNRALYSFQAAESTDAPVVHVDSNDIEATALASYHGIISDYLLVAHNAAVDIYNETLHLKGSMSLHGSPKFSITGGLSTLQSSASGYPSGVFALAFKNDDATGLAIGSFNEALSALGVEANTDYSPKHSPCEQCESPITEQCSQNGFATDAGICSCFPGFLGSDCSEVACNGDCSGHGSCIGPNVCNCIDGWAGPSCSFVAIKAKFETDANGGDGDDPAIWIHPTRPDQSKIITTTKSGQGQGFAVFDLQGKFLQHLAAKEPNNVDIIYNFTVGGRTVDLAYAACRTDNTLCLVEINSTGLIQPIPGGTQVLPDKYKPYGSCTYHSRKTGKEYLFVNNKKAEYLQYQLTSSPSGTLQTALVRRFQGGSGGQVEGCVADDEVGVLFIGEEPLGIWRYEAEPNRSNDGALIAKVGDASGLEADVEGITLVPAKNGPDGYIIASSQGISSYFVYQRAAPHDFVMTFTIVDNREKGIDHVSNTDGVAAVGNALNHDFPRGLVVTHDDANELAGGGTAKEASFKLSSLVDILGEERVKKLGY